MSTPFVSDYLKVAIDSSDRPTDPTDPTELDTNPEMIAFRFEADTQTLIFWDPVNAEYLIVNLGAAVIADGSVTDAKLADMAAWSLKARNQATAGAPENVALADLTAEAVPASGDFLVGFLATGELRRFDIGNLPSGVGYTDAEAQDAVGVILSDAGDIDFTYVANTSITGAVKNDSVSNAKLADANAWTIKMRNAGSAGDLSDAALADITEEAAPAAGDFLLGFLADGSIAVIDVANLPSSGGGGEGYCASLILGTTIVGSPTAQTQITFDATTTEEFNDTFDPGDGGPAQRIWLGANFSFDTADVDTTDDEITETGHGFTTGEGPVWFSSTTTLPAGISASTNYWIIVVDANTFKVATSRANAIAGTAVDITTQGTGTHTCLRGHNFCIPDGVTAVELTCYLPCTNISGNLNCGFGKNGTQFVTHYIRTDNTSERACFPSGPVAVTGGDRMQLIIGADDTFDLQSSAKFGIKFLKWSV